jgi:Bacteriophage tail sheath protein
VATSYLTPGVYVEEVPSSSATLAAGATAIAAFVGFTEKFPTDDPSDPQGLRPRLVTSWTQFEDLYGGLTPGAMLPHSVYGWFLNGGSVCYIVRVANSEPAGEPASRALPAADRALGAPVTIESVEPDADVQVVVRSEEGGDDDAPATFGVSVIETGEEVESYDGITLVAGDRNIETVLNAESERVRVATIEALDADVDQTITMLKPGSFPLEKATPTPVDVKPRAFAGSETDRTGINGLVIADDVTMVMVPDLVTAATQEDGSVDLGMWKAVQTALINHCEAAGNRMAVLDSPPAMSVQDVKEWRSEVAMYDSAFAAFYYPWISVDNPVATNGDSTLLVPPSGHMAGVWARTDDTRGVHKAPANEVIRGALDVESAITKAEQGLLNPIGVNCIRPFGTRGIRVWGARTLASDTDWTYINVRRLFNMIETTILEGTQFAVFEPNDWRLWGRLDRTITSFLTGLWRDGALFGESADQAFFVKCDAETNPPDSIDQGKVIMEIGIAPVKPAEFVIFRISQFKDTE